jgi:hypothetical protein
MEVANTQAYYHSVTITAVKSFIVQPQLCCVLRFLEKSGKISKKLHFYNFLPTFSTNGTVIMFYYYGFTAVKTVKMCFYGHKFTNFKAVILANR